MSYEPLHHKYRPQIFADLVGQEAIATTLTNAIATQRIAPAYLFTGPRGTGKTSSARILAKSLNCVNFPVPTAQPCGKCEVCKSIASGYAVDVVEIDAASNTGVDNIREVIERAQFAPVQCRYKVYVIDECHMLSAAAFNALLKTLEEPPSRVVFVLATTDPQRVLPTIISRCQRFDFRRIPLEAMVQHLHYIATQEIITIADDAVTLVAQVAQGGLRDAESLLDQLSLLAGEITVEKVWDLVGAVPERDLIALSEAIASDNSQIVIEQCRRLMDRGREPLVVLQNMASFYRDLLIAKTAPERNDLVAVTLPTWNQLCELAQQLDIPKILHGQQHLKNSEVQIKNTTQPRLWLEITLLGLLPSANIWVPVAPSQPVSGHNSVNTQSFKPENRQNPIPNLSKDHTPNHQPSVSHQTAQPNRQQPTTSTSHPSAAEVSQTPSQAPPASAAPTQEQQIEPAAAVSELVGFDQIWQNVLAHTQPPFTQGLLREHGRLLAFDHAVARIGIKTQPLLRLVQGKLASIEAAFESIYKYKVKVSLQVGITDSDNTTSFASPKAKPPGAATNAPTPPAPDPKSANNYPPPPTAQQVSSSNVSDRETLSNKDANSAFAKPQEPAEASGRHLVEPQTSLKADYEENLSTPNQRQERPSTPELDWDADEVERTLGSLKQVFEGEIVELTNELSIIGQLKAAGAKQDDPVNEAVLDSSPSEATAFEGLASAWAARLQNTQSSALPSQEAEKQLDAIEPATTPQLPSPDPNTPHHSLDSPEQGDWEDDDDLPF